jgi:hypothetical protein
VKRTTRSNERCSKRIDRRRIEKIKWRGFNRKASKVSVRFLGSSHWNNDSRTCRNKRFRGLKTNAGIATCHNRNLPVRSTPAITSAVLFAGPNPLSIGNCDMKVR